MFKVAEELMQKIKETLVINEPALAGGKVTYFSVPCPGGCGTNCSGSCAGSCRGNCTGSCQRYSR